MLRCSDCYDSSPCRRLRTAMLSGACCCGDINSTGTAFVIGAVLCGEGILFLVRFKYDAPSSSSSDENASNNSSLDNRLFMLLPGPARITCISYCVDYYLVRIMTRSMTSLRQSFSERSLNSRYLHVES